MAIADLPSRAPVREDSGTPRIGFFSADWCAGPQINLGGSDYWRLALPAAKLFEDGWNVVFARNLASNDAGRICIQDPQGNWLDDRDVIVIQRWMGKGTAEHILRAREQGQIIIQEVDDDYWNFPEGHVAMAATDPKLREDTNREHYRESILASSLISVSTPYLADVLKDWGPPIRLVPNYIDTKWWQLQPPGDFVGWVGGLPWRGKDLEILRDTVVPWLRTRNQFFYHGGAIPNMLMEDKLGYDRITTRPLCQIPNYPRLWEPLRVALVPLEDSLFNRAKSWIKPLEAATRGVPVIYSPHAEYERLGVGLCARTPEDWVFWLDALEDPGFYADQVAANRQRAEELSIDKHWREWTSLYLEDS